LAPVGFDRGQSFFGEAETRRHRTAARGML